jgi:hypothetical protein
MNSQIKNYLVCVVLFFSCSLMQAPPCVTTFVNTANVNLQLELHYSDDTIDKKGIALSQSYQVVNFPTKIMTSVIFSSTDKDKNGNFYGQLHQKFAAPTMNVTYQISLQDVPAHIVKAGPGTEEFKMPDSQEFVCKFAPVKKDDKKK